MSYHSNSDFLQNKLLKVCLQQNIPFVSYRLPLINDIITLIQHNSLPEKLFQLDNLYAKKGFIVAPFAESVDNGVFFLNPDIILNSNEIESELIQILEKKKKIIGLKKNENSFISTSYEEFTTNVKKIVEKIEAGYLRKVVLSKVKVDKLPETFNAEEFFIKLCHKYPHAFVYIMQLPEVGCWIGATPEPLLTIENGKVQTVSLAGTQLSLHKNTETHRWNKKEIEEQKIVTNYIEKTLLDFQLSDIKKIGPENYKAANLIHLRTIFEFSKSELQNRIADFLKAIHPTPSVGGLPKKEAIDFILSIEKHNRSYYSGFFGTININHKSAIFVNLRCMQLFQKEFVLYSGAGITAESVAEKEWEETDNKMLTLINVLNEQDYSF